MFTIVYVRRNNVDYSINELQKAYKFSSNHKDELQKDNICGCFYCLNIFNPREVSRWIEDKSGTAICPYCGIDSIIGESSGYLITEDFLKALQNQYF